jgi:acetyl-CoA carboxylase carboxyl transferase subunit alpha
MSQLRVPIIATVTGEGGSGGALAIGVADRVNMLEYSIYSVIAPESCSAILWRDQQHAAEAAAALKLTPEDLKKHKLIDEIIPEPEGGAHNDHAGMAECLGQKLNGQLNELLKVSPERLIESRYSKFRAMGAFGE